MRYTYMDNLRIGLRSVYECRTGCKIFLRGNSVFDRMTEG